MAISLSLGAFFISGTCFIICYKQITLEVCWSVLTALVKQMLRSFIFWRCLRMVLLIPASYLDFSFIFTLLYVLHSVWLFSLKPSFPIWNCVQLCDSLWSTWKGALGAAFICLPSIAALCCWLLKHEHHTCCICSQIDWIPVTMLIFMCFCGTLFSLFCSVFRILFFVLQWKL